MINLKQTFKIEHIPHKRGSEAPSPDAEKVYTIYKLTCKSTNRSYVGCTCDLNRRLSQHITYSANPKANEYNFAISKAIRQYGIDDFELEILDTTDDKDLAFDVMEKGYIELYDTFNSGYNSTKGGVGGFGRINTPEQRKAVRLAALRDIEKIKKRLSLRNRNTKWVTNGVRSTRIPKNARVPAGFKPGRASFHLFKKAA